MVILKTLVGNLSANVNEITFTDATINSNSIIEVYYNNNDIYTLETWQRENTIGIVTSDHDFPVSVKVLINNVIAFEPYDDTEVLSQLSDLDGRVTDAEDAISGLATRVGNAEDDIDALEDAVSNLNTSKQDTLTAGDNITIENNVISASGGSDLSYSTTERKIGKWIDGTTDVYETTVYWEHVSGQGNTLVTLNHGVANIDKIVNYDFMFGVGNYGFKTIPLTDQNWFAMISAVRPTDVQYRLGYQYSNYPLMLKLHYTKSST